MKARLLEFADRLRAAGLRITPAETLDATRAVAAVGIEAEPFREALAASLVKDEADRATFDEVFEAFFAAPSNAVGKRRRARPPGSGQGKAPHASHSGHPSKQNRSNARPIPLPSPAADREQATERRRRMAQLRSVQDVPLKELSPGQIDDCDMLAAHLAERLRRHASRRSTRSRRGRIDIRRTVRRSITSGGVPLALLTRERRPGKADLVALCDLSHSVAVATRFFLSLLAPAPAFFRRTRFFAYVDTPVETWLEDGHLVHDDTVDLHARSDLGNVLRVFCERHPALVTRNTVLLVLGDARNNRRPSRADLLARLKSAAKRTVWLNPEAVERWNTGDSAMRAYAPYCDEILQASTLRQLFLALKTIDFGV